jgi:hypothetical protein
MKPQILPAKKIPIKDFFNQQLDHCLNFGGKFILSLVEGLHSSEDGY